MSSELIGGRYRVERPLGTGGMAEVFAAEDLELERRVAIKMLGREADRERFRREAKALASLAHPNIAQVYDYGETGGRPYLVLEYLAGGTLEDRLRAGKSLPDETTAQIAADVAAGLAHAHANGIVHRDLKPGNVYFEAEGRAKLGDFGIARVGGEGTLTEAGTILGTASYIAPEQARGEGATAASDVYAWGVILYRMLTGRVPFEGETALDVVRKHINEPPPPALEVRPDAPPHLARMAMTALAKDPAERPSDGAALASVLAGDEATVLLARPAAAAASAPEPGRRRRGLLVPVLAFAVLGGAGVAAALTLTGDDEPDAPALEPAPAPRLRPRATTARAPRPATPVTTEAETQEETTTRARETRPTPPVVRPTTRRQTTAPAPSPPPQTRTQPATTAEPPPPTTTATTTEPTTTAPTTTEVTTAPVTTAPEPPVTTG